MKTHAEAPAATRPWVSWAQGLAAVGVAAAAVGLLAERERTWAALLVNDVYFLALALAAVVFLAIHYLAGAGWWVVLRRLPEALAAYLPVGAALLLLLYFGREVLWPWSRPEAAADPLIAAKAAYLNTPFFFLRMVAFLALWCLFARLLRRASLAQDGEGGGAGGGMRAHRRMVRLSGLFLPLFAVTFSLASFDWLMSLDPHWYSTIFAVYLFAGALLQGVAAITLGAVLLRDRTDFGEAIGAAHLHDLGKLLFGFAIFWAYIWVCQYLLIWYSNLPEEVTFYLARTRGSWAPAFFLVPVLQWAVPFFVLMSRNAKRRPRTLFWVAATVLAGRWLDLWVLVGPEVVGAPCLGVLELLLTAGSAGLFLAVTLRALHGAPLLARRDPYLAESLAHHS
jgi:hypothetical protein